MAQYVRTDAFAGDRRRFASGGGDMLGQNVLKAQASHRVGTGVEEQLRSAADWAHFEPSLHSCGRLLPERQDTFTTALAHDVHAGHVTLRTQIEGEARWL
jgi:hypothetical protein